MKIDKFIDELKKINITATSEQMQKLENYYNYLVEYNEHTNLTAIVDKDSVYLKHFYDSLTLVKAVDLTKVSNVVDIGSGAGFPGVVIKIFFPHLDLTVVDSNGKKTKFITNLVDKLQLDGVKVIHGRAEDIAKDYLNSFDLCVSRAVAFLDIITELSFPFIKKDGMVILMKGNLTSEKSIIDKYQQELNIKTSQIINFTLPETTDERNLVLLTKKNLTTKLLNYSQIIKRNKKWNHNK